MPYFLFFIWPLALMGKEFQLLILISLSVYFLLRYKKEILNRVLSKGEIILGAYCFLYLVSIACNAFSSQLNRIYASINTALLWFISLFLFICYRSLNLNKFILSRIALWDMIVMISLSIVYFIFPQFNFYILDRSFIGGDWINGERTVRFFCFFEYANLVSVFCLILFPLSLQYIAKKKTRLFGYVYCLLSILPILASASRSAFFLGIVMILTGILYVRKNVSRKILSNKSILGIIAILLCSCVVLFSKDIFSKIYSIFISRSGSNNERFSLYQYSILEMLNNSPLIGCGIKRIAPQFGESVPLGSHSTYVGVLYKTGILGCAIFLIALYSIIKRILSNNGFDPYLFVFIFVLIVYFVFEDIDGADWVLALLFSVAGCFSGKTFSDRGMKNTSCNNLLAVLY